MRRRIVGVWRFERVGHQFHRFTLAPPPFGPVDLFTAGRHLPPSVGEVPLRRDPVVIKGDLGVVNERQRHVGAVARTDHRLVGLAGDPPGGVQSVEAGPAVVVDPDVRLRSALDEADGIETTEIRGIGPRGRKRVVGDERRCVALDPDSKAVPGRFQRLHAAVPEEAAVPLGLPFEQVGEQAGVDAGWKPRHVLEVCVPTQYRLAVVYDDGVEAGTGEERGGGQPGDAAADDGDTGRLGPSLRVGVGGVIGAEVRIGGVHTNGFGQPPYKRPGFRREAFVGENRSVTVSNYVLYGGKGGVGKTTCAAATALARAREGTPTLVVSTDPAHSLSDVFDTPVGAEPTRIREGLDLWAVEVDPGERIGRYRGQVSAALEELEDLGITLDGDLDDVMEAGIAPGTDEAAAMDLFVDYMDDPRYGCLVFDTAPTGHTLRLLKLPDVMESAMGKLVSVRAQVSGLADSVRGLLGTGNEDGPDDDAPELDLEALQARMERVGDALRDPERTAFHVVLVPETMAVLESERLLSELDSYGIPVEGVVVNKVLEDPSPECQRCQSRHRSQQDRIAEARERFDRPLTLVPELEGEVHGFDAVEEIATQFRSMA